MVNSGNQLRHVKRLNLSLQSTGNLDEFWQATDARALLDHLYMPSVEFITIKFDVSDYPQGYLSDFACVREALCRIELRTLQHVTVCETIHINDVPVSEVWVSI